MKRLTFFFIILFIYLITLGQGEYNVWYFGGYAGMDFNGGAPVALLNSAMTTTEGSSCIADASGNLLFYTDGLTVWNRNHVVMTNGTGLHGNQSSIQAALIIPWPQDPDKYFIFTTTNNALANGMKYSVVDMSLSAGLGSVTTKNVALITPCSEKLTAVPHSNCTDFWVITHGYGNNNFYAYQVTPAGVNHTPVITSIGSNHNGGSAGAFNSALGMIKASPNGTRIACADQFLDHFDVFDFNNTTGVLSNFIPLGPIYRAFGVEFSPDNTKLYVSERQGSQMWQFNLAAGGAAAIQASKTLITNAGTYNYGALQRANDGKIYLARSGQGSLGVINNPNGLGAACNYVENGFNLAGRTSYEGLPTLTMMYNAPIILILDTITNFTVCSGQPVSLYVDPDMPGTSYLWNTGATTNPLVVSPTTTTTYTVTANYNGCTATASATVTVLSSINVDITPSNASICTGQSITLTASGANNYTWSHGLGTNPVQNVSPGATTTYTVTGTDTWGCTGTASATVTVSPDLTVNITPSTTSICNGENITLTASGGNSYSWSGGLGTGNPQNVSPSSTTTYTVTGSDGFGCTGTASVTVTVNPNPTVTITPSAPSICAGSSVSLTAGGANTYNWSGGLGTGATQNVSPTTTTTYTVTGTSAAGCTGTASVTVTVNPNLTVSLTPSAPQICAGQSVSITASGGTTYNWSGGLGTNATQNVSPGTTTTYTVTGTDAFGCSGTASVTVTVNPNPAVTISPSAPQICAGQSVTITAGGANTYSWSGGMGTNAAQNVSPAATTTYTVTGTSTAGCTGTASVTVTVNPNPTVTITPSAPSICAGSSVSLTAGGANTYNWSGGMGTNAAQNVSPGTTTTYTVTGTTAAGCTGTASATVTVNPNPTVNISPSAPQICAGQSVTITAGGANTYNWSGGLGTNATQNVSPTTTTTYTVTGTTAAGCTGTASATVTVNPNPTVTISPSAPQICEGQSVTITAGGANTYNWSGGMGTNAAQNVSPTATTTYTVTGTSTAGCTGTASVTVTVNSNPTITATANPSGVCLGNSTTLSAGGGNTYLWDSGNTNASWDVTPTVTTTYYVTGTDANGCSGTAHVQVDVFDNLTVTITPANPEICEGDNTILTANSNGSGLTYNWSSGQTSSSITVSPPITTDYSVFVEDNMGCTGSAQITVTVHPIPNISFEAIPLSGCVPITVSFTNTGDAGSCVWDFGDGSTSTNLNPTHQYANSGSYGVTLTITSAAGCSNSLTISGYIQVHPIPVAAFHPSSTMLSEDESTVYFTDLSMGASSWYWDFGTNEANGYSTSQNPDYTFMNDGTYTVWQYVENQWGCRDSTSINITVKPSATFYIPNAFSPNSDGINDYFHPFGNNIDTDNYQMIIYDRWGKQIFRTDNINTPWDGTSPDSGGKIVPTGVYVYKITVTLEGLEKVFEGIVTLVF